MLRLEWRHMFVKKCAYRVDPELLLRRPPGGLAVGLGEGAGRGGSCWIKKEGEGERASELCDTHTHTLTTPSEPGPPSQRSPRLRVSLLVQRGDRISVGGAVKKKQTKKNYRPRASSQRQDLELLVLRVKEALQPVRVGEVCGRDVTGHCSAL